MMFDKHANLKYKFGNRHFWAEGYYVSSVELNEATIRKYIEKQEKHDIAVDKLSVKKYEDPFKIMLYREPPAMRVRIDRPIWGGKRCKGIVS